MASSGSAYIFESMRGRKGNVVVVGRAKVGNNATLEARDLGLTRIMGIQLSPWGNDRFALVAGSSGSTSTKRYDRSMIWTNGSIGSIGSLNSYVKVRTYYAQTFGSFNVKSAAPQGTKGIYIGTKAGSTSLSFMAWGH